MKKEIKIDVSEEFTISTKVEEFQFVNDVWNEIKDEVFMKAPPNRVEISSANFKLTFVEKENG